MPSAELSRRDEKVVGYARHSLAMLYQSREKYKEALAELEKLHKDFPGYAYAQGQAVFIALKARDAAKAGGEEGDAEAEKVWTKAARQALDRMGPLPVGAEPSTTLMWFMAEMEGPKFLYADGGDLFNVYSNKGELDLHGGDGNDTFVLRAFVEA